LANFSYINRKALNKRGSVRNTEARSRNHYCRGKARSIIYSECVCP